ncbi:hypothetical protein AKJ56_02420 [candidate division MSBL1 archaeon SCGC-AAA382N08]|uniref:Uncharacterized protein n=1 Tax=candidate division MSBL1 archaeon SCGC-AAA382N08 TaxID=1698285 RepID=A0A133VMM6_9EURY|nr:hypothetical protein AKJ56_02420 [candidate division MSBL1 archaeon SCGC-AAA382N08]
MERDPFEEMEKKMKEMMKGGMSGSGRSISIKQTSDGTTIDVGGEVPDEEIESLKENYPDAEIRVDGENIEKKDEDGPVIEVIDEED